jgi:hypothetical protein
MPTEQEMWKEYVTRVEQPEDRMISTQTITKDELDFKTMKLEPTIMTQRETRCRAVFKIRYGEKGKPKYQRCVNIAYLDAYVDPAEQHGSEGRVALCWVHAGVCLRGNLRVSR